MALGKSIKLFTRYLPDVPPSVILEQRGNSASLLFEGNSVAELGTGKADQLKKTWNYKKALEAYACLGVLQLNAGQDTVQFLALVTGVTSVGKIGDSEIFRITQVVLHSLRNNSQDEERISELRRLLSSGTFYFSWSANGEPMDITLCAQRQNLVAPTDNRFFWNKSFHSYFMRYGIDSGPWLTKAICGSVEIRTVYAGHRQAKTAVISRLSCERVGTRFNVRGCNDEGSVANFVETEQLIFVDNEITSFVQIRGSVPLFWEQPGVQVGSHKVRMSRGPEMSLPAFDRHMRSTKRRYGKFAIVNLLGVSLVGAKEGEAKLSTQFQSHHEACTHHNDIPHIIFDYHEQCRGGNLNNLQKLLDELRSHLDSSTIFHIKDGGLVSQQSGVVRTNCLDCLDRTNCVQTFLGLETLLKQLTAIGAADKQQTVTRFEEVFRQMWINNGNEVSKMYAGTGAIQGGSKLIDGARSAARTIQNNLLDSGKQEAIEIFLSGGAYASELGDKARALLPPPLVQGSTAFLKVICSRYPEYTYPTKLKVAVGTYNVNGGNHFRSVVYKNVSLADWLLDAPKLSRSRSLVDLENSATDEIPVDIFAIGFEEMVDLNASNIMAASSENARAWAIELEKVLSRDRRYCLLTSVQLVGVCLYVFARPELAPYVREVSTDTVKTGLGGATGNKGGVCIRFLFHSTPIAFVCSHFAAGQSQVKERNADYTEVAQNLSFPFARSLHSHDYVFWCGDFNYRVDVEREKMKDLILEGDLPTLLEADQLKVQQAKGTTFQDYLEGEINFPPTYKYDLFSDDYDTSEKCRIPAWTDRVLLRRRKYGDVGPDWTPGEVLFYGRAELKQSDHRPVIGIFEIDVLRVDDDLRSGIVADVVKRIGPQDGTVVVKTNPELDPSSADDGFGPAFLAEMNLCGDVATVRRTPDRTILVVFREGFGALAALKYDGREICGRVLHITLRNLNYDNLTRKDLALFSDSATPLIPSLSPSLSVNFEESYAALHIAEDGLSDEESVVVREAPTRPKAPPARPAPPPASDSRRPSPSRNGRVSPQERSAHDSPVLRPAPQPPTTLALTKPLTTYVDSSLSSESPPSNPPPGPAPVLRTVSVSGEVPNFKGPTPAPRKSPPSGEAPKVNGRPLPPVPPRGGNPPVPVRAGKTSALPTVPGRNGLPPVPPRS